MPHLYYSVTETTCNTNLRLFEERYRLVSRSVGTGFYNRNYYIRKINQILGLDILV